MVDSRKPQNCATNKILRNSYNKKLYYVLPTAQHSTVLWYRIKDNQNGE